MSEFYRADGSSIWSAKGHKRDRMNPIGSVISFPLIPARPDTVQAARYNSRLFLSLLSIHLYSNSKVSQTL